MKVAFLSDSGNADGSIGGAELTMQEFAEAAPDNVELVELQDAETVVIGNCVSYGPDLMLDLRGKPVYWFHNDLSPWINPELKVRLDQKATHIFCSPLQRDRYGLDGHLIPPALDFDRFVRKPREGDVEIVTTHGRKRSVEKIDNRRGTVSIGAWQNPGKGQQSLLEWSKANEPVTVYGNGPFAPTQPPLDYKGPLQPDEVPGVLERYERFVHLPWDVEPFGRCVVEAWASGLELVLNRNVGATYWIEEAPEKLESAGEDFWALLV